MSKKIDEKEALEILGNRVAELESENAKLSMLRDAQDEALEALGNRAAGLESELRNSPDAAPTFEIELDDCRVRVLHGLMMKDEYEVWRPKSAAEIAEDPTLVKRLLAQKSTAVEIVE